MIYDIPRAVTDPEEKLYGLRCLTEHVAAGQWDYARLPNRKELAATALLALPLDEASVKVRSGPPEDGNGPDAELGLWACVLPMRTEWGEPDPALSEHVPVPPHNFHLATQAVPLPTSGSPPRGVRLWLRSAWPSSCGCCWSPPWWRHRQAFNVMGGAGRATGRLHGQAVGSCCSLT